MKENKPVLPFFLTPQDNNPQLATEFNSEAISIGM